MVTALGIALIQQTSASALDRYLSKPEPAYAWKEVDGPAGATQISLTSQTWQGQDWKHQIVVVTPKKDLKPDSAILFVTGNWAPRDLPFIKLFADTANLKVAVLFDIPNQPRWDRNEDALIAYTFQKYMETKDATWPLLFPMTKATVKAMDAVQGWSKGSIKNFVVSGASKRGWTTWLAGATGDKRIKAIAPMVIDVLNMPAQLAHQRKMFGGKLSEQIADYSTTGLTELIESKDGQGLINMVDPYNYLNRVKIPTLIVLGSNDRYWTADAHRLYWNKVREPKFIRIVPNVGHNLGGGVDAVASVSFFSRAIFGVLPGGLPKIKRSAMKKGESYAVLGDPRIVGFQAWSASSKTYDFRDSKFAAWLQRGAAPQGTKEATFLEYKFEAGGLKASFTSMMTVSPEPK